MAAEREASRMDYGTRKEKAEKMATLFYTKIKKKLSTVKPYPLAHDCPSKFLMIMYFTSYFMSHVLSIA